MCVEGTDLCLDFDLCVGEPAADLLHEHQFNHVVLEPATHTQSNEGSL